MLGKQRVGLLLATVVVLALALVACQPQQVETIVEVTRVVTETEVVEGEPVEVTRIVTETETITEEVVVEVTAVPEGEAMAPMEPSNPTTWVQMTFGDIATMDPALAYDTASSTIIEAVMEPLITFNHKDDNTYVPALAVEVPSAENGLISEDGLTYTFNIRDGVTFHEGGTLEPHDVAYTFHRGLLQSDPSSAQLLLLEPLLGYISADVTEEIDEGAYAGDREALIANASPEDLVATCEKVMASVVADDDAGTVTFNLAQPWSPLLGTLAGSWGHIIDMEWAMEQGDWDGSCETWQNFYAPGNEGDALNNVINGTGPFMLENWTPNEEYSLVRNDNYWRTEETPLWEGGPFGPPALERVVVQNVEEWGTRFAALQAGDADYIVINAANETQVDPFVGQLCDWQTDECTPTDNPDGFLVKYDFLPRPAHDALHFNQAIPADSPFIGSGQLDGNGIPADFFSDLDVRQAMATCFDYDTFMSEVQNGKGVRLNGPIIRDMLGYNEDGPQYDYDPEACAAHLEAAWGGQLPETGFRFQVAYNTGNNTRQTAAEILQAELSAINPNYVIEIVGLPWPSYLAAFQASQLPMSVGGWIQDIPDPHNWVQPFTWGYYADGMNVPDEMQQPFLEMGTAAIQATDPAERERIYFEMQQMYYDTAMQAPLPQALTFRVIQPWVKNFYYRPGSAYQLNWYPLSKE